MAADFGGDCVQGDAEVGDLGDQPGEGAGFPSARAVFLDDGAEVGVAVEGGSAEAGAGGDAVEGDRVVRRDASSAQASSTRWRSLVGCHPDLRLIDVGVEAFDEAAVAFGFAAPAAGFGVAGEGFGVGALRGEDG